MGTGLITERQLDLANAAAGYIPVWNAATGRLELQAAGNVAARPPWTNPPSDPPVPDEADIGRLWIHPDVGVMIAADDGTGNMGFAIVAAAPTEHGIEELVRSREFSCSGVFLDYTAEPQWLMGANASGLFGDDVSMPEFYALRQFDFGGLERNVSGLSYTLPAASDPAGNDVWPRGNDGGQVVIPLGTNKRIAVVASFVTNLPSQPAPGAGESTVIRFGLSRGIAGAVDPPQEAALWSVEITDGVNAGAITESTDANGADPYSASVAGDVGDGVLTRYVRFIVEGGVVSVDTGASPGALARRSEDVDHALNAVPCAWFLSFAGLHIDTAVPPSTTYIRLSGLQIQTL